MINQLKLNRLQNQKLALKPIKNQLLRLLLKQKLPGPNRKAPESGKRLRRNSIIQNIDKGRCNILPFLFAATYKNSDAGTKPRQSTKTLETMK
jgi:hypothetical protein